MRWSEASEALARHAAEVLATSLGRLHVYSEALAVQPRGVQVLPDVAEDYNPGALKDLQRLG